MSTNDVLADRIGDELAVDPLKISSRILIIDDEESLRLTFKMFLSREGYGPIDVAATYDEALQFIKERQFDLIISDIVLEGNSGIDILRQVKESGLSCPMVMITGYPNIESAAEAVRLGAFDYLAKPVKKDGLLRTARMALQQHALWKERSRLLAEQEKNRQYLETIFRSVSDAIITLDQELRIVDMNDTARRWASNIPEIKLGAPVSILPGACGETCARNAAAVINQHKEIHEHRVECEIDGLGRRILQVNVYPLEDRQNRLHGVVLLLRDVTQQERREEKAIRSRFHRLIGVSPAMQTVYTLIEHLGPVDTALLITGESGTGKELVAEALHAESARHEMPLIKVDCTAIAEDLLESELFGHRKGSFTGADRDREGRIIQADGGTLFLDEIGDISPRMQLRLLRFLQEQTFYPVGQDRPVRVDIRVIAATNAPLQEKVTQGSFREDLYFRLRVVDIPLPPLRDRHGDLPILVNHFIDRFGNRLGKGISGISDQALAALERYAWPGNVRQLEHIMERACIMCADSTITLVDLAEEVLHTVNPSNRGSALYTPSTAPLPAPPGSDEVQNLMQSEEEKILTALRQSGGNKARAARLLGIDRSTLYRKMWSHNINPEAT